MIGIISGFLSRFKGNSSGKFLWEDHYKLKEISVKDHLWEVGSNFGDHKEVMTKVEKITSERDEQCEVLYRDISRTLPGNQHFGFELKWMEKMAQDIA